MKKLLLLPLAFVLCSFAYAQDFLIDVRSNQEYNQEHVTNAINIPHTEIVEGAKTLGIKHDDNISVYCRSGRRASMAQEALEKAGYKNVKNLGGLKDAQAVLGK